MLRAAVGPKELVFCCADVSVDDPVAAGNVVLDADGLRELGFDSGSSEDF